MWLIGFAHVKRRLRQRLDSQGRQQMPDFPQLARVAARNDQLLHCLSVFLGQLPDTNAFLWASISSRIPCCARSSIAFNSSRVNGAPSAVPCISTRPKSPVITTFISVSQRESSS